MSNVISVFCLESVLRVSQIKRVYTTSFHRNRLQVIIEKSIKQSDRRRKIQTKTTQKQLIDETFKYVVL